MSDAAEGPRHVSYADAGVDVDEGARAVDAIKDMVSATNRPEVIGGLGGFGSLFSAAALKDMEDPILVSGTDGVGTKLAIAQLLDRHETVGEDLVAMCVDDIVVSGAEPLFFLDYVAVGKLESERMARIVSGIARGCELSGCALVGGEMAEHPGVMEPDDYDLAGFVVGVVDRPQMLGAHLVCEGDVILGLPSSGLHSNGYSLVRKVAVEGVEAAELERPRDEFGGESLADGLLAPTSIYAGGLIRALRTGAPIHAMAHITGGGITENLNRVLPEHLDALVDRGAPNPDSPDGFGDGPVWDVPWVIDYVVSQAGLTPDEAYRTFNMGVGMAVICSAQDVDECAEALSAEGFEPFVMGEIVSGTGRVVYR
ncbi:MAG: phosphoribosylformylglycinamidine cyclo-ligase [Atopobiaceae bacterium]|nr:phosphoribosylformylglycinamidine cyclo-ligase [Atopobiaceae bacterium]